MPLQLSNLNYDSKMDRAFVVLIDSQPNGGATVQATFPMNAAPTDTQHDINQRMKAKAKEFLQAAIAEL